MSVNYSGATWAADSFGGSLDGIVVPREEFRAHFT